MLPARSCCIAFALIALVRLPAAGTLTVGPPGSGAQFTEIQAAIDAALDDDVILVQPGTYQRIVVDKPLRILGDGTGSVTILTDGIFLPGLALAVTVRDIRAGEELVLSGIDALSNGSGTSAMLVLLGNCQGTVILHDVDIQAVSSEMGLRVDNALGRWCSTAGSRAAAAPVSLGPSPAPASKR